MKLDRDEMVRVIGRALRREFPLVDHFMKTQDLHAAWQFWCGLGENIVEAIEKAEKEKP